MNFRMIFGKLTSVSFCRYAADEDSSIPSTESSSIADSGYQSDQDTYLTALREQRRRRSARMDKCRRVAFDFKQKRDAMRNEAQKVALELMATENEVKDLKTRIRDTQGSLFEARAQIKAYERRLASVERPDEPQPPLATETSSCAVCLGGAREMVFIPCGHVIACKSCVDQLRSSAKERLEPFKCPLCMEPADCAVRVYFN